VVKPARGTPCCLSYIDIILGPRILLGRPARRHRLAREMLKLFKLHIWLDCMGKGSEQNMAEFLIEPNIHPLAVLLSVVSDVVTRSWSLGCKLAISFRIGPRCPSARHAYSPQQTLMLDLCAIARCKEGSKLDMKVYASFLPDSHTFTTSLKQHEWEQKCIL
jgi:hypothetical protein